MKDLMRLHAPKRLPFGVHIMIDGYCAGVRTIARSWDASPLLGRTCPTRK